MTLHWKDWLKECRDDPDNPIGETIEGRCAKEALAEIEALGEALDAMEQRVFALHIIVKRFKDYYPSGINPDLDEAYGMAIDALSVPQTDSSTYKGHRYTCGLLIEGGKPECTCGALPTK